MNHRPLQSLGLDHLMNFWTRVKKTDNCWIWIGAILEKGTKRETASFCYRNVHYYAPRVSFFIHTGIDPGELNVCHDCDYPLCVRPNHLWLGTQQENIEDCTSKGRNFFSYMGKLSMLHVTEILQAIDEGEYIESIANRYSVTKSTISKIRYKRIHKVR